MSVDERSQMDFVSRQHLWFGRMHFSRRTLPGVAVVGHAIACVTVNLVGAQNGFWVIALVFAQHSLLYLWAGLGRGRWVPRLAIAYGVSVLAWSVPAIVRSAADAVQILAAQCVGVAVLMVVVVVPLAVARSRGFRLELLARESLPYGRAFQTSVRTMLLVTAVVAGLLAFGASVDDGSYMRAGLHTSATTMAKVLMIIGLPTLFLSSALLSVWTTLSAGTVPSRMVVGGAALAAGGAFLPYCLHGDAISYGFWAGLPVLTFLITSVTLLFFRVAGYRFMRTAC